MKPPWSGDASETDDIGTCLNCSLQKCASFAVLVKSLWPLPITGVLCVCIRWCPDDRCPQGATAGVGEDCQANVRKGLALGVCFQQVSACLAIRIPSEKSFACRKVKDGLVIATVFWFEQRSPGPSGNKAKWTQRLKLWSAAFYARALPQRSLRGKRSSLG